MLHGNITTSGSISLATQATRIEKSGNNIKFYDINTPLGKTLQEFTSYVNVTTFGAVGNGIANDTGALQAAINNAASSSYGIVLVPSGNFLITSSILLPSNVTIRGDGRDKTTFVSTIVPNNNVTNATFYARADAATAATTINQTTTTGSNSISVMDDIASGSIITINDTVGGAGLRTMSYDVISGSGDAAPYTIYVDRPILFQYYSGSAVSVIPNQPSNITLEDFSIRGSATRFIEIVTAKNCTAQRINMLVTSGSHDIMGSYDVGGRGNAWIDIYADAGGIAADCLAHEGQEDSIFRGCKANRATSYGIVLHDCIHSVLDDCHSRKNAFGLVVTADGTTSGSYGTVIRGGSYTGNTTEGISLVNGSVDTTIDAADVRFNPKAITATGDIARVVVSNSNLSAHTINAIVTNTGATAIRLRGCNLTGTSATIPISAAGDLDLEGCRIDTCKQIALINGKVTFRGCYMKCKPAAAENVLYLSSGTPRVSLLQCQLECATSNCNMVSIATGTCTIMQTTITQVDGATGVIGLYISGGTLIVGSGVDASGCTTPRSSAGGTTNLTIETSDATISNANVSSSAAIAGTKIDPNFGTQTITITSGLTATTEIGQGRSQTSIHALITAGAPLETIATIAVAGDAATYLVEADIVALADDGSEGSAFKVARSFVWTGAVLGAIDALVSLLAQESTPAKTDVNISASGTDILVTCGGTADYRWAARVTWTRIKFV